MYGYMIHGISDAEALAEHCCHHDGIRAWVPECEKWYSSKGKKAYVRKKLYPDCVIAFSEASYPTFCKKLSAFTKEDMQVHALTAQENALIRQLFHDRTYIEHSVGRIICSRLVVESGPLKGLEQEVMKIDRHHRIAIMKMELIGRLLKVALEVVSKS